MRLRLLLMIMCFAISLIPVAMISRITKFSNCVCVPRINPSDYACGWVCDIIFYLLATSKINKKH